MDAADSSTLMHGSAVAVGDAGVLILGRSGAGKSSLAIELIALGAALVADDQVLLEPKGEGLLMSAPANLQGMIEARQLGLLAQPCKPAWARLVVDLDQVETTRLPEPRETVIAGVPLRLIHRVESGAFQSMLYLLMQGGFA